MCACGERWVCLHARVAALEAWSYCGALVPGTWCTASPHLVYKCVCEWGGSGRAVVKRALPRCVMRSNLLPEEGLGWCASGVMCVRGWQWIRLRQGGELAWGDVSCMACMQRSCIRGCGEADLRCRWVGIGCLVSSGQLVEVSGWRGRMLDACVLNELGASAVRC